MMQVEHHPCVSFLLAWGQGCYVSWFVAEYNGLCCEEVVPWINCVLLKFLTDELEESSLFWQSLRNICYWTRSLGQRYLGRDSCTVHCSLTPLDMSLELETCLCIRVPDCINYRCAVLHLALQEWQLLHLCVLPKHIGTLGFGDMYYCCHVKNNHRSLFGCWRSARIRHAW